MVSVCLPSGALLQHLPSYLGLSYLCVGYLFTAAPVKHSHCSLVHQSQLPALSVLVVAERSYFMFKVRRGSRKDIPLVQGKGQWLHFTGVAVKRYPTSKIRETQVIW